MESSGEWFRLKMPYLPSDRYAYPRSAFAGLWTKRPEDADGAYEIYRDKLRDGGGTDSQLMLAFEGRPFRCATLDESHQYEVAWGECAWNNQQRGEVVKSLSPLSGNAILMLKAVLGRVRPALVSSISYSIPSSDLIVSELVLSRICELTITKKGEPALAFVGTNREVFKWEIERRLWLCQMLRVNQFAYEATQSSLRSYRESGEASRVEVESKDCCSVCFSKYPGIVSIAREIEIPVEGCLNNNFCTCVVLPILDVPLGH